MNIEKIILGISLLYAVSCQGIENDTAVQPPVSPAEILDGQNLPYMAKSESEKKLKSAFEKIPQETLVKELKKYEKIMEGAVISRTKDFQKLLARKQEEEFQCPQVSFGAKLKTKFSITLSDSAYGSMNSKKYNKHDVILFKDQNVLFSALPHYGSSSLDPENGSYTWLITHCPHGEIFVKNDVSYCGENNKGFVVFKSNSQSADFSFPAVGEYKVSLFVKDRVRGGCANVLEEVQVESNAPFSPLESRFEPPSDKRALVKQYPQLHQISAIEAWDRSKKGEGITIAVIGTGVDYNNKYINQNILDSSCEKSSSGDYVVTEECEIPGNGVDDDKNGYVDDIAGWNFVFNNAMPVDRDGHETAAASVAASPIFGVAPKAKILPVSVYGNAKNGKSFEEHLSLAIRYAVDKKVNIISISFSGDYHRLVASITSMAKAIEYAQKNGVVIFAAVQNLSLNFSNEVTGGENLLGQVPYPAGFSTKYNNVFAVTGSSPDGRLASDVAYGTPYIQFMAPVLVEALNIENSLSKKTDKDTLSIIGTSFSTPIMAGVAALVWSTNPNLSIDGLRNILMKSNIPQDELQGKVQSLGLINACMAVEYARGRDEAAINDCPDHSDDREVWGEVRYNTVKNWQHGGQ